MHERVCDGFILALRLIASFHLLIVASRDAVKSFPDGVSCIASIPEQCCIGPVIQSNRMIVTAFILTLTLESGRENSMPIFRFDWSFFIF